MCSRYCSSYTVQRPFARHVQCEVIVCAADQNTCWAGLVQTGQIALDIAQTRQNRRFLSVDAAVSADSPSAPELLSRLAALERRLARRDCTIDEHASKMEAARAEGLIEGTRVGARAAYADSACRLREVASSTWHTDNKPVRDALRSVATRLVKLANGDIE